MGADGGAHKESEDPWIGNGPWGSAEEEAGELANWKAGKPVLCACTCVAPPWYILGSSAVKVVG
jgi:hypothetical protein